MSIRDLSENELRVLGSEIRGECRSRSPNAAGIEEDGLGGNDGMAMRIEEPRKTDGAAE
jgi:hypothetical protein